MAKVAVKTSENVQGGADRLRTPGWYHMSVNAADVNDKKGVPIDGFRVEFVVEQGPESGKTFEMTFFNPKLSAKEEAQMWSARKQTAFLIACGLMTENQLAKDVEFDTDDAAGRNVVIHLQRDDRTENAGKEYLQLAFADIFHIDDPRVAEKKIPLNAEVLKLIPAAQRRDPKSFDLEKLTGKKQAANGKSNGSTSNGHASSQPAAAAATAGVNIDDL